MKDLIVAVVYICLGLICLLGMIGVFTGLSWIGINLIRFAFDPYAIHFTRPFALFLGGALVAFVSYLVFKMVEALDE